MAASAVSLLAVLSDLFGITALADAVAALQQQLDRVEQRIIAMNKTITTDLDALTADVAADTNVIGSVNTLLNSLTGKVDGLSKELAASGVSDADVAKVRAIADAIRNNTAILSQAVAANTPAAPVGTTPAPADPAAPKGDELAAKPD